MDVTPHSVYRLRITLNQGERDEIKTELFLLFVEVAVRALLVFIFMVAVDKSKVCIQIRALAALLQALFVYITT